MGIFVKVVIKATVSYIVASVCWLANEAMVWFGYLTPTFWSTFLLQKRPNLYSNRHLEFLNFFKKTA